MDKNEIVIFETEDKMITIPVAVGNETVWLNRNQMAELFDRDVKTIGKHINNALKEELESDKTTVAKFATVQKEGQREVERQIEFYNLDVIISVGYHVKSKRGFICGWGKEKEDAALVALTIMIAESRPEEKEMMISVIMNCML